MSGFVIKETARRIADIRKQKGLRAEDVAERAGIHRATYYRYEAGDGKTIKIDKLQAIADALNVHLADLVIWGEDEKPTLEEENGLDAELLRRLMSLTPEEIVKVDAFVQGLLAAR